MIIKFESSLIVYTCAYISCCSLSIISHFIIYKYKALNSLASLFSYEGKVFLIHAINPYPTAFPYGNGMVLHFYQQQESSTTKTVHKVINKELKAYV